MEPPPDNSWLTFERTDWRGRTQTLDYKGRPITSREPPAHACQCCCCRDHTAIPR